MKVLIFGDSFSTEFHDMCEKYVEWKKYEPKNFGEIISERLNIGYKNFAFGGLDNYSIFHSVTDNENEINDDDILIIGWSSPYRFRIVDTYHNHWMSILPNIEYDKIFYEQFLSKNSLNEIFINRAHNMYANEVNKFINIINRLHLNNKIIHWTWLDTNINVDVKFTNYDTIYKETNGEVKDYHINEACANKLSNDLLNLIKKK